MTDQQPTPKDPPKTAETPEARMTGEGAPPPDEELGERRTPGHEVTDPTEDPDPLEPPD